VDLLVFAIILWLLYRHPRPGDGPPSSGIVDGVEDVLERLVTLGRGCAVVLLLAFVVACAISVAVWVTRAVGAMFAAR
jgi:hypothetical protein